MPHFNPTKPNLVRLSDAMPLIGNAWLAQFRGSSWVSRLIEYGTGGVHSHSGMLARNNGHCDLLELREFIGPRRLPLERHVRLNPGVIDLFSPDTRRWPEFRARYAVEVMRDMTSRDYGYAGVSRLALRKVPLVWRMWPLSVEDEDILGTTGAPFCSHAVCHACRVGGGVDPVPRKPDHLVTPNDLTWSMLFEYRCTLVPDDFGELELDRKYPATMAEIREGKA